MQNPVRALDWARHGRSIRDKVVEWFDIITQELRGVMYVQQHVKGPFKVTSLSSR